MKVRQREFIVGICEKVVIYLLTIALVGQFLEKGVKLGHIIVIFAICVVLFLIGLNVSGREKE